MKLINYLEILWRKCLPIWPLLMLLVALAGFFTLEQCSFFGAALTPLWGLLNNVVSGLWSGLEWPHAAVIIFCLLLFKFQEELRSFISRLDEVGVTGLKAPRAPIQPDVAQEDEITNAAALDPATIARAFHPGGYPMPPIYFPTQMQISLAGVDAELGGVEEADRINYLKERLAFCRVQQNFEFIYGIAFGGQLRFLRLLNETVMGLPDARVDAEWEAHQSRFKPTFDEWTKDQYLNFLVVQDLVISLPNGNVGVSLKGREFLAWVFAQGRSLDKPW